jgi:arsenate reductase
MSELPKILVLCTGNSCRSQMMEGFLRKQVGDLFDIHSAGLRPAAQVHPLAVDVMNEIGIDLSDQHPKDVQVYLGRASFRYVIVVCDGAQRDCPRIFPGALERLYWPFDDPAAFRGSDDETQAEFRRVRDQICDRVNEWVAAQPWARDRISSAV